MENGTKDFRIIIVGGGIAGLATVSERADSAQQYAAVVLRGRRDADTAIRVSRSGPQGAPLLFLSARAC